MPKNILVVGILIVLVSVGLMGCNEILLSSNIDSRLVGTWVYTTYGVDLVITFFSDGKFNDEYLFSGEYEIKDEKLVISSVIDGTEFSRVYDYYFTESNTKLHLTEVGTDETTIYTKQ